MELPRIGVITIQGGGAVAIDLIGQLQGLTGRPADDAGIPTGDKGLLPAAVAGTSAGAIIATLYWAGYSPEAIRDEVVNLFAPTRLNDFFGHSGGWFPLRFRGFAAVANALSALSRGTIPFLRHLFWPERRRWLLPVWWCWQIISLPIRFAATLCALFRRRGIFPGDGMEREIDRLLRESPLLKPYEARLPPDGLLRFYDVRALQDPRTMPLFLIITDVRGANIVVVSSIDDDCQELPIARCARASGGFPGFFRPISLSDSFDTCVDGGMISNFPAWVFGFDYRRSLRASANPQLVELAYVPWLHVGLRLAPGPTPSPERFEGFLKALVSLLTGRARARLDEKLATVVAKRRTVSPSPAPPGAAPDNVLDFDALSDPGLVMAAFERGRINGQQAIEAGCFELPASEDIKPILVALVERASFLLKEWLTPGSKVRANIFVPQGAELILAYQANMDGDPDEKIHFSRGQGITSLVYSRRVTVVADLRSRRQSGRFDPGGLDLYLTRTGVPAVLQDRTWLLSMPLIDVTEMWPTPSEVPGGEALSLDMDGPTLGVLNIDAAVDYGRFGAPTPDQAATHPAVLALFDGMKSAALRCSMVCNRRFLG